MVQERAVTRMEVLIAERSAIRRDVIPYFDRQRKCIVDFKVRVGRDWYVAYGEHTWDGHRPDAEACAIAVAKAEDSVRERVSHAQSISERIVICKDQPALTTIRGSQIGNVGDRGQFRPHPARPERFFYNGTQCAWFIEPQFTGERIHNFQGIVCELHDSKWVVVDRF